MFLTRLRRKTGFKELGFQYGCGETTARTYFGEMLQTFCDNLVPHLVFPRTPDELRGMTKDEVSKVFPDLLAILDAENREILKVENFLKNRESYSAYQSLDAVQVLFGKYHPFKLL
jgi:hypothetical protein